MTDAATAPTRTRFSRLAAPFRAAFGAALNVALPLVGVVPVQFILALPYVLTVLLLAGFVGRAVPPKALGMPYAKER